MMISITSIVSGNGDGGGSSSSSSSSSSNSCSNYGTLYLLFVPPQKYRLYWKRRVKSWAYRAMETEWYSNDYFIQAPSRNRRRIFRIDTKVCCVEFISLLALWAGEG